jgi:hypothetical protein
MCVGSTPSRRTDEIAGKFSTPSYPLHNKAVNVELQGPAALSPWKAEPVPSVPLSGIKTRPLRSHLLTEFTYTLDLNMYFT